MFKQCRIKWWTGTYLLYHLWFKASGAISTLSRPLISILRPWSLPDLGSLLSTQRHSQHKRCTSKLPCKNAPRFSWQRLQAWP
jgi:hypothetical protein